MNNNVALFLFASTPAFIYMFILIKFTPKNSISKQGLITGLITGAISTFLVTSFQFMFPTYMSAISNSLYINIAFLSFIQVALLEEVCKFFAYRSGRVINEKTIPIAIMIYCMLPSVSFSIIENIQYIKKFPFNSWTIAFQRSITAVPLHILCGAIMGYFISLGHSIKKYNNKFLGKIVNKSNKTRVIFYSIVGVTSATTLHGLYDLNVFLTAFTGDQTKIESMWNTFFILLGAAIIVRFMVKHLNKISR